MKSTCNRPECVPVEDRAARHVLDLLQPYSEEQGGPLKIQHVSFIEVCLFGLLTRQGCADPCMVHKPDEIRPLPLLARLCREGATLLWR